ncbi:unnamed protein product [Trichobilharzia szidati]|nr:unnamed protein product [Trichobilharzia szidati]
MGQQFSHRWKPYKCRIHQNGPEVIEIIYPDEDVEELERVNVAEEEKSANINNLTRNSHSEYNETNRINKYENYDYNGIDRMKVKERHDMESKDEILIEGTTYMNKHLRKSHSLYRQISPTDGDLQSSMSSIVDLAKKGGNLSSLNIQSSSLLGLPNITEIDKGIESSKESSGADNIIENDQWDGSIDKLLYTEPKRTPLTCANNIDSSSIGNFIGVTSDYRRMNTEDYARRESVNNIIPSDELTSTDILLHKDYLHSYYDTNEKHSSITTSRDLSNELTTNMETTITSSRGKYKSKSFLFINPTQKIDRPLFCHLQTSSPPPPPPISHPDMNDMKTGDYKDCGTLQCLRKSKSFKHIAGDSISTMSVNDTFTPTPINKENLIKSELQTMHTTLNTTTNCLNESLINSKDRDNDSRLKIDTDNLFNIESDNLSLLSVQEPILRVTAYSPKWLNRCASNLTLLRLQPNNTQSLKNNLHGNQFSVDYIENKSPYEDKIIPECLKLLESRYLLKMQQK